MTGQPQDRPVRQRRRGEELEEALLDAAWEELESVGFARLTMESVAARAKTGVAVLYRRWPRKNDLVFAALRRYGQELHPVAIPDTGSLRGDMLTLLNEAAQARGSFMAVVIATFTGILADSGITPAEARTQILGDSAGRSKEVYLRAHERGEIDLHRIPEAVLAMPWDLMRHDLLMTLKPVPPERIQSIVDDLFMPLATASRQQADGKRPSPTGSRAAPATRRVGRPDC